MKTHVSKINLVKSLLLIKDEGLKMIITNWHGFNVLIFDKNKTLVSVKSKTPEEAICAAQGYLNEHVPVGKYMYCALLNVSHPVSTQCELWGDFPY